MAKAKYKYYPVVQNPEKAPFRRSFVYVNKRDWTDPSGIHQRAVCKSITPNGNGMYVVDMNGEYAKEKLAVLENAIEKGIFPIMGPFNSVEEAFTEERAVRPLTQKEKITQADSVLDENKALKERIAQLESGGGDFIPENPVEDK